MRTFVYVDKNGILRTQAIETTTKLERKAEKSTAKKEKKAKVGVIP